MFNFIKNIGTTEMILIAVILVLVFGPKLVKSLGRTSGETFKEVKKIKKEFTEAVKDGDKPSKN
jgi:TatA/E family protein of Tat protein translocase